MVYKLANNAVSSLSIAIENFKKFFYHEEDYKTSELDEAIKICIVFLENAIELLLKTIIVEDKPLAIYICPQSKVIKKTLKKVNESLRLEDILVAEGNFKTITYSDAVKFYNDEYITSNKVFSILVKLGETRNAITHFGINKEGYKSEIIIDILNAFDVIYNYLYPQLIDINSISHFFTSDGLMVETVHGIKPLFNDDYVYNNFVDFFDEVMEVANGYALKSRSLNPNYKIKDFLEIMKATIEDRKFSEMLNRNQAKILFNICNFSENEFYFDVMIKEELADVVLTSYSRFFNVTAFCNESGVIYFVVDHHQSKLYLYGFNSISIWPDCDKPEPDMLWENDLKNGLCEKINLSKRNLLKAFDVMTRSYD